MLVTQLAWVIDPRVLLAPIARNATRPDPMWLAAIAGAAVMAASLRRWWLGRARESERLFACGVLANAVSGVWLYGNPLQFQLGMSLEPLFVLALAQQLASLDRPRVMASVAALLLAARTFTWGSLLFSERKSDNAMLSGVAQRALVEQVRARHIADDDLLTTTYDHVGVIETWTGEQSRPMHAWRALKRAPREQLATRWGLVLDTVPACHVLLTRQPYLFAGPFTDLEGVAAGLDAALSARGARIDERIVLHGVSGAPVFELLRISPCGVRRSL
jgi:hypothetical protein